MTNESNSFDHLKNKKFLQPIESTKFPFESIKSLCDITPVPSPFLHSFKKIENFKIPSIDESFRRLLPEYRKFSSNISPLEELAKLQKQLELPINEVFAGLQLSALKVIEDITKQFKISAKITQSDSLSFIFSKNFQLTPEWSKNWDQSITKITAQIPDLLIHSGLDNRRERLIFRLLEPSRVYTQFVQKTIDELARTDDKNINKALYTSIILAEKQLLDHTDILTNDLIISQENEDDDEWSSNEDLLLLDIQQDELINLAKEGNCNDEISLIKNSETSYISDLARYVLKLIALCNNNRKIIGEKEIFKPTTRLIEVASDFPWLLPLNQSSFANFIDCLYFILYEGAGKDKLRFYIEHGGVLNDEDCQLIWCIKYLRNKWLRHDPDHGEEKKIEKDWKSLGEKLKCLGLQYLPKNEKDFHYLHKRLLEETVAFLENILEKMKEN